MLGDASFCGRVHCHAGQIAYGIVRIRKAFHLCDGVDVSAWLCISIVSSRLISSRLLCSCMRPGRVVGVAGHVEVEMEVREGMCVLVCVRMYGRSM